MSKISKLAEKANNALMQSPQMILEQALLDIEDTEAKHAFANGNKMLILALNDNDDSFNISWSQAGMRMSQCVALCEAAKTMFLKEMDF